jgi:acyl dehydratase
LTIDDLTIGREAGIEWRVRAEDIDAYAALSGDRNPLHLDDDHARGRGFRGRLAHGGLLGAKISQLLGTKLPGRRCLVLEQSLVHLKPVYVGDRVRIAGRVREVWPELAVVEIAVTAIAEREGGNETVAKGRVRCKVQS